MDIYMYKIGKVYFAEYADIQKVFFTPHHVGHCSTDVTREVIVEQQCIPTMTSVPIVA
jgi:hypothetical protein